jgi:ankyrin repeat protein
MRNQLLLLTAFIVFLTSGVTADLLIKTNPIGKVYSNSIQLSNKIIPLPEGEWKVIGRGATGDANYFEIILLKESEKTGKMPSSIIITTDSPTNTYHGYTACAYCGRKDVHYIVVKNNTEGRAQDCWLINHYIMSMNASRPAVKEAYDYFLSNKITIPKVLVQSFHHFTSAHSSKYLEVAYFSNPEVEGFEPSIDSNWSTSEWHPLRINNDPKKMAYIERLKTEGAIIHEKIRQGFEGRISENSESNSNTTKPETINTSSQEKLTQPSPLQGSTEVPVTTPSPAPTPTPVNTKDRFISKDKNIDFELGKAANAGDITKVKELINKGADVNNTKGFNKTTPLMSAIMGGEKSIEAVKILLEKGANVNDKDSEDMSPLLWAVYTGNVEELKLLISKGADVNAKNIHGMTPLLGAFTLGSDGAKILAEPLINAGADVNVNTRGVTPLLIALGKGMYETAKLLVNKGADVNANNEKGVTALMFALIGGGDMSIAMPGSRPREVDTELINLLLVKGADVNAKTDAGLTPLFFAVTLNADIVKLLLDKGANVNAKTKNGKTLLGFIKEKGNPEVIRMLKEAGAKD